MALPETRGSVELVQGFVTGGLAAIGRYDAVPVEEGLHLLRAEILAGRSGPQAQYPDSDRQRGASKIDETASSSDRISFRQQDNERRGPTR